MRHLHELPVHVVHFLLDASPYRGVFLFSFFFSYSSQKKRMAVAVVVVATLTSTEIFIITKSSAQRSIVVEFSTMHHSW